MSYLMSELFEIDFVYVILIIGRNTPLTKGTLRIRQA